MESAARSRPIARRARGLRGRAPARCGPALAAALALAGPAATPALAARYTTPERALAEAFPGSRIEARSFVLTGPQRAAVQQRARARLESGILAVHLAWRGDTLAGAGFVDRRVVRTMPGVFLTAVAPDTTVARVEVLAFHEPPDYLPPGRWLGLFPRRRLDDRLWPRRDLRNLSGATLSARAVTESVRLALAGYELVVAPALAPAASATATPAPPRPGGGAK